MNKFLRCVKGESSRKLPNDRDLPGVTFQWQEIEEGTGNFQSGNYLGKGKFGEVFRCNLPRTNQVGAAKIQKDKVYDDVHLETVAEIRTLHEANHPNVIKLLGKWIESKRSVIVYEFMPKGSLDHHLYATEPGPGLPQKHPVLDWGMRMNIAVGVAEALAYLHETLKVIHLDVKDANVLLDENLVPKLTDFGFAKKIVKDENGVEKQSVTYNKTIGFAAPELEFRALVSTKSDVYSYGVFLLTLFTGRKGYDSERRPKKLTDWMKAVWRRQEDYVPVVVDPTLGNRYSAEGLRRILHAARICLTTQILDRPKMSFVEQMVRDAASCQIWESTPVTRRRSTSDV